MRSWKILLFGCLLLIFYESSGSLIPRRKKLHNDEACRGPAHQCKKDLHGIIRERRRSKNGRVLLARAQHDPIHVTQGPPNTIAPHFTPFSEPGPIHTMPQGNSRYSSTTPMPATHFPGNTFEPVHTAGPLTSTTRRATTKKTTRTRPPHHLTTPLEPVFGSSSTTAASTTTQGTKPVVIFSSTARMMLSSTRTTRRSTTSTRRSTTTTTNGPMITDGEKPPMASTTPRGGGGFTTDGGQHHTPFFPTREP